MAKEIKCKKCGKKLKEHHEVGFVGDDVWCRKCWDRQPYRKLKNIK